MEKVLDIITAERLALQETPLIRWLGNRDISLKEKYSFIPSMAFFIMGFRDILLHLKVESPANDIEKLVSQHCMEDLGHWQWYINDLERLGFDFSA